VWLDCIENKLKSMAVKRGGRKRTTDMRGLNVKEALVKVTKEERKELARF